MLTQMSLLALPLVLGAFAWPVMLLGLVFLLGIFEAAASLVFGGFGLQPGLTPALALVSYVVLQYLLGVRYPGERQVLRLFAPLLVVSLYAILSGQVLPLVFSGEVLVWPQKMDALFPTAVPLEPNAGNLTQSAYVVADVLFALAAALIVTRSDVDPRRVLRAYWISGLVVTVLCIWQLANRLGGAWYPSDFLYSNPGWAINDNQQIDGIPRLNGPFTEPAALSTFMCGIVYASGWTLLHHGGGRFLALVLIGGVLSVMLSTSTTGLVTLAIGLALLALYALVWASRRVQARLLTVALPAAAGAGLLVFCLATFAPSVITSATTVFTSTTTKGESSSYEDRTAADRDSLAVLEPTFGFGVGWGSTRSSSLVPGFLANLGVYGSALVIWFGVSLSRSRARLLSATAAAGHQTVISAACAGMTGILVASLLSAPTISSIGFYLLLGLLIGCLARAQLAPSAARIRATGDLVAQQG